MPLLCLISCACWVSSLCFLFVNVQDLCLLFKGLWLCWGWEKKSDHLFLSDTKLASRERAKLCFKAVRCKTSEGRFFPERGNFLKKILFGYYMLKLWLPMMLKQCFLFLSLRKLHICRYCLWKWTGRWMDTTAYFVLCKLSLSCVRTKRW